MLIVHETPNNYRNMSANEVQQVFEKYRAWSEKIRATGKWASGDKLTEDGGKILSVKDGRFDVVDGPYSEAKEVLGGYFTIRAESYEEAIELLRDCPHLAYGRLSLRQVDPQGCGGGD